MKTNEPNIISLPDVKRIEQEAAGWVMRLQSSPSSDEIARFEKWRTQSSKHKATFEELSEFWQGLDFVEQLADYAQNDAVIEPLRNDRAARRMKYFKRTATGAVAASLMAMVGVPSYNLATQNRNVTAIYETAVGEQETIVLPDGSQIILNTNSAVSVNYSKLARKISLSQGEAFFDVEPNKNKPFSVSTDKGIVTAVGTAFSVRLSDEKLDVLVTEGRVALSAAITQSIVEKQTGDKVVTMPRVFEVSAGQSAVLGKGVEKIAMVKPLAFEKEVDWQDGELKFDGETLEQVIQEVSRYTEVTIEILGDELRAQRIVSYYKVGDIERLFEALNVMANVEVERVSSTHVKLYRIQ